MENAELDPRYTPRSEHYALRERVAVLENRLELKLDGIASDMKALAQRPQSNTALDQAALGLHNLAQSLANPATRPSGNKLSHYLLAAIGGGIAIIAGMHQIGWHF